VSKPTPAESVKLAASIFYADRRLLREILDGLSGQYGAADFISSEMPFNYTDYYSKEMGPSLSRRFVFFEVLMRPESLPEVKLYTNHMEEAFSMAGQRQVNIDPGYISKAHLILATGKGYAHRPYLRDGIYADLTLVYMDKSFHPLPWTYPDYAEKKVIDIFNRIRAKYAEQIKH
jgi:hypothetical protein